MSRSALRQYQHQAVRSSGPAALIDKLYGIGLTAARAGDAPRARRVLVELTTALDLDRGGDLAVQLRDLYAFAIRAANDGDLGVVAELMAGLREAWREGPLARERAAVEAPAFIPAAVA